MGQISAPLVGNRQLAENVVEHTGRHLDGVVTLDQARRLETGKDIGIDEFIQRHAILKADRNGDREVVHHRAKRRPFLVHVEENLTNPAVIVFTGPKVNLVTADDRLLGVALAPLRQPGTLLDPLHDFLGHHLRLLGGRLFHHIIKFLLGQDRGRERL